MDATKTLLDELNSLREEVHNLRNENITLYNELTRQNKTLCEQILSLREQNAELCNALNKQHLTMSDELLTLFGGKSAVTQTLRIYLRELAGMQTAQFIVDKMPTVKAFENKSADCFVVAEEYLRYVLSQVNAGADDLFLEFGVFGGRSITLSAWAMPDKIIYGFDSFEGLPENFRYDWAKGSFDMRGVEPIVPDNVRLIKGWFNETLPQFVKAHPQKCAYIHVDCDLYSSTKTIFDNLKHQIGAGTIIAFDEYFNYPGWQEYEYKVFMEFVEENDIDFEYIARTDYEQAAVRIK